MSIQRRLDAMDYYSTSIASKRHRSDIEIFAISHSVVSASSGYFPIRPHTGIPRFAHGPSTRETAAQIQASVNGERPAFDSQWKYP